MTDLDKAREEWENRRLSIVRNDYSSDSYPAQAVSAADALIAALEAEVGRKDKAWADAFANESEKHAELEIELVKRTKAAEAEVERLEAALTRAKFQSYNELRKARRERDRLAWMLERIRDSEYDRMSDADALADLAARYEARHEGGDG